MILDMKKDLMKPELKMIIGALISEDKKIISELLDSHKEDLGITFNDIKELVLSSSIIPSDAVYGMINTAIENSKSKVEDSIKRFKTLLTEKDLQLIAKLSFIPDWIKAKL